MTDPSRLESNGSVRSLALAMLVLGFALTACTNNSHPVPERDFSTRIVGHWQGTVGDSREAMSIKGDGTFVCQIHQTGFIANMIYPVVPGKIGGTWTVNANIVTLRITAAKNERLANRTASSVIVSMNENELVLKSDRGETSSFMRVHAP